MVKSKHYLINNQYSINDLPSYDEVLFIIHADHGDNSENNLDMFKSKYPHIFKNPNYSNKICNIGENIISILSSENINHEVIYKILITEIINFNLKF